MRNLLICGSILSVLAVGCERKAEAPAAPTAAAKVEAPAVPAASTETPPTPAVDVQVPAAPAPAAMADATKTTESSAVTGDAQSKLVLVVQYIKD